MPRNGPGNQTDYFLWKQVSVVGMQHHDFKGELHKIKPGAMLVLEREYMNQYDVDAIVVRDPITNGKVGYIARTSNPDVARFMDNGYDPKAYVQVSDGITLILNLWMKRLNENPN